MKGYVDSHYPDLPSKKQRSYEQLCEIVEGDQISPNTLRELIGSMGEAATNPKGSHTKYK
jgi:hypothetical protein